ncbi:MAG: preprotein translocase subunit SecE [Gammaproteobacteria bacterium HGW-Gammaproteobacteria-8]|nr:MAG: preprotein translocase subunit SecE [Gammaproteobacteria bacterium HGW-Gammaproteobacteria-8]
MAAEKSASTDIVFWILAAAVVLAGGYGFVYFEGEVMPLLRVLGLLVAIGVATFIAAKTSKGAEFFSYMREADVERRKVVWPTRQETFQTTIVVIIVTIIVAIILALFDLAFGGIVRWLIGLGGGL